MWIKIYTVAIALFLLSYGWQFNAMIVLLPAYLIYFFLDARQTEFRRDLKNLRDKISVWNKHFRTEKT